MINLDWRFEFWLQILRFVNTTCKSLYDRLYLSSRGSDKDYMLLVGDLVSANEEKRHFHGIERTTFQISGKIIEKELLHHLISNENLSFTKIPTEVYSVFPFCSLFLIYFSVQVYSIQDCSRFQICVGIVTHFVSTL